MIRNERIKILNNLSENLNGKYVFYMMQASQRISYNHALFYAVNEANRLNKPLLVGFSIMPYFPNANTRHYYFMFEGLEELIKDFKNMGVELVIKFGNYEDIFEMLSKDSVLSVIDKGYLRFQRKIMEEAVKRAKVKVVEVESDVVVPVEYASNKKEPYARTIRNKLMDKMDYFLAENLEIPEIRNKAYSSIKKDSDFGSKEEALKRLKVEKLSSVSKFFKGGYPEAFKRLNVFLKEKIYNYDKRNDPSENLTSDLSPYLHFGQISPIEVIKETVKNKIQPDILDSFIDELVVWRELARNFTTYEKEYDKQSCIPDWAKKELDFHLKDKRGYVYSLKQLENCSTHDEYWNAAQKELVSTGKIHNYMRMYWGKKIIEWSKDWREALDILIYLNDKYAIDGRDPNGYLNIAWCFGKFDRPFFEMPIFGKVRYMSFKGLERKFNMSGYIKRIKIL
ncbi:MAG: deoxyribodipyrimidine photo-lyase [Elusimicrobiota bacterium]